MVRSSFWASALAFGMAASLSACGDGPAETPKAAPPPAVEAAPVRGAETTATVTATGALERQREAQLSFRVPGVITALNVEEGDAAEAHALAEGAEMGAEAVETVKMA